MTKLIILNMASLEDIADVICLDKDSDDGLHRRELRHWDSSWIDFDKFAYAIGVDRKQLDGAFLGHLGLGDFRPSKVIRHCPECIRHHYHSVLFHIESISRCPWHGHKLQECECCSQSLRNVSWHDRAYRGASSIILSCRSHLAGREGGAGVACGHLSIPLAQTTSFNRLPTPMEARIASVAGECVAWWARAADESRERFGIPPPHLVKLEQKPDHSKPLLLGCCINLAGPPPFLPSWGYSCIDWIRWADTGGPVIPDPEQVRKNISGVYKCVRRHIYRRYVKPHKRCLNYLVHAKYRGALPIRTDHACATCIAYVSWRLGIERLPDRTALSHKYIPSIYTDQQSWKDDHFQVVSEASAARLLVGGFYGLWSEIAERRYHDTMLIIITNIYPAPVISKLLLLHKAFYCRRVKRERPGGYISGVGRPEEANGCLIFRAKKDLVRISDCSCGYGVKPEYKLPKRKRADDGESMAAYLDGGWALFSIGPESRDIVEPRGVYQHVYV